VPAGKPPVGHIALQVPPEALQPPAVHGASVWRGSVRRRPTPATGRPRQCPVVMSHSSTGAHSSGAPA
jgi:hypothetical protein